MPSSFGWVDFGEKERQQMLNVVHMFSMPDTRDELGLGSIRDAFADHFFPGTSTIQTRAKYFLFIPWIYKSLEAKGIAAKDVARLARAAEVVLIDKLLASEDTDGIIGKEARANLQRLPSNIYWAGLGAWGVRLLPISQHEYQRSFDHITKAKRTVMLTDDKEPLSSAAELWHPGLPDIPRGFPEHANFSLTIEEALYLRDRVTLKHSKSLLAALLLRPDLVESDFPWEHPIVHTLPAQLKSTLKYAQNFSQVMHGAAILYNLMLSRQVPHDKGREWEEDYTELLNTWAQNIAKRGREIRDWSLPDLWIVLDNLEARVHPATKTFIQHWVELCRSHLDSLERLAQEPTALTLITQRERLLKKARARLNNPRALETWPGSAGAGQLEYRWSTVEVLVRDIVTGISEGALHVKP